MVVPRNMDIHYISPMNRPADEKDSETVTTHFDYHSINDRLTLRTSSFSWLKYIFLASCCVTVLPPSTKAPAFISVSYTHLQDVGKQLSQKSCPGSAHAGRRHTHDFLPGSQEHCDDGGKGKDIRYHHTVHFPGYLHLAARMVCYNNSAAGLGCVWFPGGVFPAFGFLFRSLFRLLPAGVCGPA